MNAKSAHPVVAFALFALLFPTLNSFGARSQVPREHPYLLGSRAELQALAKARPAEYQRMARVAHDTGADTYSRILSAGLVSAIEGDHVLASEVHRLAMEMVNGPIRAGHVTFGYDLALCGFAYDLCHEAWPAADRLKLHEYINKTVDANVKNETSVFHNAWYSYKNWGIGVASYATYHENGRSPAHLRVLENDYLTRAAPALELAGDGGGWAEGYYIHYWLYEWLFFCEIARRVEGLDLYEAAPNFYRNRAVAAMFEAYPGTGEYNTRRSIPMGDGGGRTYGGDRDKDLNARRILASYFRDDPSAQAVHAFNEATPRAGSGNNAYKDFLWHDTAVKKGALSQFKLSHYSRGPGFVYARSSWDDDATHFYFKCGDRFTAHQHLDVGHFLIYNHSELAGDGGHYTDFGGPHDVNYHLRTIAHSTMLVADPGEKWPSIRAGKCESNDGGQHHSWRHHNGAVSDPAEWQREKALCDIADMIAFEDRGNHVYVAGDATRAYSSNKVELFTRQIVFLRPSTFVIFDRVTSTQPEFRKTWLLQAMKPPVQRGEHFIVTNGKGRLTVQPLLPQERVTKLVAGTDLYRIGGRDYPPSRSTGPAPECRVEISPAKAARQDYFLNVLTASAAEAEMVPGATVNVSGPDVEVVIGKSRIKFRSDRVAAAVSQ